MKRRPILNFHNTIDAQGKELEQHQAKAESQTEKILRIFKAHPEQDFTPCEIQGKLSYPEIPDNSKETLLTSVRRSISNLTRDGELERTKTRRLGSHGAMNFTWKLRREPDTPAAQGDLDLDDFKEEGLF